MLIRLRLALHQCRIHNEALALESSDHVSCHVCLPTTGDIRVGNWQFIVQRKEKQFRAVPVNYTSALEIASPHEFANMCHFANRMMKKQ